MLSNPNPPEEKNPLALLPPVIDFIKGSRRSWVILINFKNKSSVNLINQTNFATGAAAFPVHQHAVARLSQCHLSHEYASTSGAVLTASAPQIQLCVDMQQLNLCSLRK